MSKWQALALTLNLNDLCLAGKKLKRKTSKEKKTSESYEDNADDDRATYVKIKITNDADYLIRDKLDKADKLLFQVCSAVTSK